MLTHSRLLRRVVLVCSLMTLTGLHESGARLSAGWRASRLAILVLLALAASANLGAVWQSFSASVYEALYHLTQLLSVLFHLALLLWWCAHRRPLHRLLSLQADLERRQPPLQGDNVSLICQSVVLSAVLLGVSVLSLGTFALSGQFHHPYYLYQIYVPEVMRTSFWYPVLIGIQLLSNLVNSSILFGFSLVIPGLVDATAVQLRQITRSLGRLFPHSEGDLASAPGAAKEAQVSPAWAELLTPAANITKNVAGGGEAAPSAITAPESDLFTSPELDLPDVAESELPAGTESVMALELCRLSDRYRQVVRMTDEMSDTFSLALLGMFATTTAILLVGVFVMVVVFDGRLQVVGQKFSYVLYMLLFVLCVSGISISGSRLIQCSVQLHGVIAKELWPRPMSPAVRRQLQLLLEQTRTPLAIEVWELFSLGKSSVLSMLSFVLTYLVIMLQMLL